MTVQTHEKPGAGVMDIIMVILILGTLWGLSEVVFDDMLRASGVPLRAAILTGIGMGLLGIAVGMGKKGLILPGIALVTVAARQLAVPLLGCTFLCKANASAAVLLEGMALAGVVACTGRFVDRGISARALTAAAGALMAAAAFYVVGTRLAPCEYLLSFTASGGLLSFMYGEGLSWAAASALGFPLGYALGTRAVEPVTHLRAEQPVSFYVSSALLLAACWIAIAATIAGVL